MEDFASTILILRQNGYVEVLLFVFAHPKEIDEKSMPLIAHLLSDLQKLQMQVFSQGIGQMRIFQVTNRFKQVCIGKPSEYSIQGVRRHDRTEFQSIYRIFHLLFS